MTLVNEYLHTGDVGEAEAYIRRIYPRATVRESRRPFAFSQRVRGDDRASFARFSISSFAEIAIEFDGLIGVGHVLGGRYAASSNGDEVDIAAPFLLRPGAARSRSEGLDLLVVNIDQRALTEFTSAHLGVDRARLRFPKVGPLAEHVCAHWIGVVHYVQSVLDSDELRVNDLIRRAAIDLLFASVLTTFPVDVTSTTAPGSDDALPRAVRRAVAFIEENAGRAIGVDDIATAARMSVRGLQAAFQRHLDTSPMAVLRSARIAAARVELLQGDPGQDSVQSIARRWGHQHLGRFAAEYRSRYGELPSETLQRR